MHRFKVHPGAETFPKHSHLYWDIMVAATNSSFARKLKEFTLEPGDSPITEDKHTKTRAIVSPFTVYKYSKYILCKHCEPILGEVLFSGPHVNAEIVAHESVHMATCFLRRIRKSLKLRSQIDFREECLAYIVGECVSQIANYLHQHKLW